MNVIILSDAHLQQLNQLLHKSLEEASNFDHSESDSIDQLMVAIGEKPSPDALMSAAVEAGATYGMFAEHYGVPKESDCYALAAQEEYKRDLGDEFELDEMVIVERSLQGAFVNCFLWVSASDAGAMEIDSLVPAMIEHIHESRSDLEEVDPAMAGKVDFVDALFDDSDSIASILRLHAIGGECVVADIAIGDVVYQTKITDLIIEVADLAKESGFDDFQYQQLMLWLAEYGSALGNKLYPVNQ